MPGVDPDNEAAFKSLVIPSDYQETVAPRNAILDAVAECGFDEDETFGVKLALEEAITNAIKHGNRRDEAKNIYIKYSVTPKKIVIIIRDEGCGFCPSEVPDPTTPDRLPLPDGRGIMLMKAYMDTVEFSDGGCEVRLTKVRR